LIRALRAKTVLERVPVKPLDGPKRYFLVTPDVDALLDGHTHFGQFPQPNADTFVAEYCAGWLRTVSRKKTKRRPDIERLEGFDEVWALCLRRLRPGWRILGRFYQKGVFVAVRAWDKNNLARRYPEAARQVLDDWQELFDVQPAHIGIEVEDYVDGVCRDVDEAD
jgi:hypothetical protein